MTDWNAELYTKLYSKLALALGVTPRPDSADEELDGLLNGARLPGRRSLVGTGTDDPQFLLALANPGQFIPPHMDPIAKPDDRYALSVLFDVVPQFSFVYRPASATVSEVYGSILDYKETPLSHLSPDQKKKLEEAEATLTKYLPAYDDYRDKYYDALDAYDNAYANYVNLGTPIPRSVKQKLADALMAWDGLGHRAAVESAIAVTAAYEALEPENYWYKLLTRFREGTETAGMSSEFQATGTSPPYKTWFEDAGWTQFVFEQRDFDNQQRSQAIGVAGNLGVEFGIFRLSAEGEYKQDSQYVQINETELRFSCELMRVALDRSWMNPLVLSSRAWRWAPGTPTYGSVLSTGGDIDGGVAPTGVMTVIPTAAILSRNLAVTGRFEDSTVKELNRTIDVQGSVGIGPFSLAARYQMEEHEGYQRGTIATDGITAEAVQIVAYVCEVLPESPNPDPTLVWPAG